MISRRSIVGGLLALAAPSIVRTPGLLMPILPPMLLVGWKLTGITKSGYRITEIIPFPEPSGSCQMTGFYQEVGPISAVYGRRPLQGPWPILVRCTKVSDCSVEQEGE